LIIAGPIVGAVSPLLGTQQQPLGSGGPELDPVADDFLQLYSTINGTHKIIVPAFNNWPLPAGASLFLTILVNGQVIYQTEPDLVQLGPFQSGNLHITMVISPSIVAQLHNNLNLGPKIGIGGTMSISEGQFFAITVSFPQG